MTSYSQWDRVSITDICESIVDCVNRTAPKVDEATPYKMIRTTNVRDGWIDLTRVNYVNRPTYDKWTRRQVPRKGDIILTREAPLGEVGMIRTSDTVFLGQRLVSYRIDPAKADNRFVLYAFQTHDLQSQIKALGSGSTVEHMRVPDAKELTLSLPSLPIQHRIASILSAYDDLIENNTRRIAILEEMARRLYEEWFVHFRFPGYDEVKMVECEIGPVPEGWEWNNLKDLIELAYGKALKKLDRIKGPYPVYGSSGIVGWHDEYLSEAPGVIVGRKGNVGSVHWTDRPFFPIDTVYFVRTNLPLEFVYFNLQRQNFLNNDAAVPGLNRNQAYALPFLKPSDEVLGLFTDQSRPIFSMIEILKRHSANLRAQRDLLLPKLIAGEIDLSSAEERVTEAAE